MTGKDYTGERDSSGVPFNPKIHGMANGVPLKTRGGRWRRKAGRKDGSTKDKWPTTKNQEMRESPEYKEFTGTTFHDQMFKSYKQFVFENKIDPLRKMADNLLEMGMNKDGNVKPELQKWAMEQFFDRFYGKATQKSETEKKITVEVVRDFSLPEPKRAVIEGEVTKVVDEDLAEVMKEIN